MATSATSIDIEMPEQTSKTITVNTEIDLTGSNVVWVASFNGMAPIKKDTETMMAMLDTAPSTTVYSGGVSAGATTIHVTKVAGFDPRPNDGKPTLDFAAGDQVNIIAANGTHQESNVIQSVNPTTKIITLATPLAYSYIAGDTFVKWITSFTFSLLPGDTILPVTKTYGTAIIGNHMAMAIYQVGLSPGNIYAKDTSLLVVRGRIFLWPILPIE
jgi:hypothetical protein